MRGFSIGDKVEIYSHVFNFKELYQTGTIVGVVGAPHYYIIRMDNDGSTKKWFGLHLRRIK